MTALVVGPQNTWYSLERENLPLWVFMNQHLSCLRKFTLDTLIEIEYLLHHQNLCISETSPWQVLDQLRQGLCLLGISDIDVGLEEARTKFALCDPNTFKVRLEKHLI